MAIVANSSLPGAADTLTMFDAFRTMHEFLAAFWERGDKQNDELAMLLSSMELYDPDDPVPLDIAQWHDFVEARDRAQRVSSR